LTIVGLNPAPVADAEPAGRQTPRRRTAPPAG
jgi:hypothetical protein